MLEQNYERLKNSPGHRPTACQSAGNSPQFLVSVPFGQGKAKLFLEDTIYGILGEGFGAQFAQSEIYQSTYLAFYAFFKRPQKLMVFLVDLGAKNGSQIHLKITKNQFLKLSRNHTLKNNKKVVFPDPPDIHKSSSRLDDMLFFTKIVFSKKSQKYSKKALKKHPKSMKNQ